MGHHNGGKHNKGNGDGINWLRAHVAYEGDECLRWPLSTDPRTGRGLIGLLGKTRWAHRVMCELVNGPPPTPRHQASHSCGRGHDACVHPKHLSWKTQTGNQLDRRKHGTHVTNPNGRRRKLEPEQIKTVIALKGQKTQLEIANMFGVSQSTVQYWHYERRKRGAKNPLSFQ